MKVQAAGFTFEIVPELTFCDVYYNRPDLPDEALLEYLAANKGWNKVHFIIKDKTIYLFVDSEPTFSDIYVGVMNCLDELTFPRQSTKLRTLIKLTNVIWKKYPLTTRTKELEQE